MCRYNLSRIFFGGFFIRGHPYTMETISFAIRFWSKVRSGLMVVAVRVGSMERAGGGRVWWG